MLQCSQENTSVAVSFWAPTEVFYCEYYQIFNNTYYEKHLRTAASVNSRATVFQEPCFTFKTKFLDFRNL